MARLLGLLLTAVSVLCAQTADRKVAEWTLAQGGRVRVEGAPSWIAEKEKLPSVEFRLEAIDWMGVNSDPPDLERLGGLRHLKALHLPGPFWNRNADGGRDGSRDMKYLAPVVSLEVLTFSDHFLDRIRFRDAGLDVIQTLRSLRELRLRQSDVRGPGLRHFPNIESLDIELCPVNDDGLAHLRGMTKLKRLLAGDTLVGDAGLAALSELGALEELDLHGTSITDAGLERLTKLTRLRRLNLMGTEAGDGAVDTLLRFRELEELNLYRTKMSNSGLSRLAGLSKLAEIDVRYSRATRAGVEALRARLPRLRVQHAESSGRPEPPAGVERLPAVEWVKALGGRVVVENGVVVEVSLAQTPAGDAGFAKLAAFPRVRKLDLSSTEAGDSGMQHVAKLTALAELNLNNTQVSDAGLRQLAALNAVRRMSVRNTYVEGELDWMGGIEELDVSGSPVGNAGLARIAALPRLRKLGLASTDIADGAPLDKLAAVEWLNLSATDLTDAGLKPLSKLIALKALLLNDARFTDAGLAGLAGLASLRQLELMRTRVSDKGMVHVGALTGLTHLKLDYGEIGDAGIGALATLKSLEVLSLDSTHVTDAGLAPLQSLSKLRELNLYHTVVTPAGYAGFRQARPGCAVVYDAESARPTRRRS